MNIFDQIDGFSRVDPKSLEAFIQQRELDLKDVGKRGLRPSQSTPQIALAGIVVIVRIIIHLKLILVRNHLEKVR